MTLKWDGTRPYESINAQQNQLIVTVVDSERVPIVNIPVQYITQDSYLYRANEVPAAPVVPSLTDTDGRIIITGIIPAPLKAYQLIVGNKNIYGNVWRKDFRYWGGEQSVTIVVE